MMLQAAGNLPATVSSTTPSSSSSSHHATSEAPEHYRQSSSKELHGYIISAIPVIALFIPLRYGAGAAVSLFSTKYDTVVAFIVAFVVYISSLAVKIFPALENPDLSEFMGKISLSSGTLAITFELLIIVPALGWFAFAAWSICLVIAVTKSYREIADVVKSLYKRAREQLRQVFDKLNELFMNSNAFNRLKKLFGIRNSDDQLAMESDQSNGASASAGVVISNAFNGLKVLFGIKNSDDQLAMESDQPNGASASARAGAGVVEITSAEA